MRALLVLLCCQLLAACGALKLQLPAEFLPLEERPDFKAVTADDARVWCREFSEPNGGDLAFWAETLRHDLVEQRGYTLVAEGDVADGDSHAGKWFECAATVDGERRGYLVAVFRIDRGLLKKRPYVRTLEFTAREEDFQRLLPAVKQAIPTLQR